MAVRVTLVLLGLAIASLLVSLPVDAEGPGGERAGAGDSRGLGGPGNDERGPTEGGRVRGDGGEGGFGSRWGHVPSGVASDRGGEAGLRGTLPDGGGGGGGAVGGASDGSPCAGIGAGAGSIEDRLGSANRARLASAHALVAPDALVASDTWLYTLAVFQWELEHVDDADLERASMGLGALARVPVTPDLVQRLATTLCLRLSAQQVATVAAGAERHRTGGSR